MKNSKIIIGAVVAVVIIIVLVMVSDESSAPTASPEASASVSATPVASATPTPRSGATTAPKTLTYQEALNKYSGTRIQFDARCQAIPNQLVVKTGTAVMLDNRSGDARSFSVGTVKYTLPGYGFRIITASSTTFPKTLVIDCGSAQNVGQILIQR